MFPREAEFTFSVDNPAFVLARASEKLGPKKGTSISVTFKPDSGGVGRAGSAKQQAAAGNSGGTAADAAAAGGTTNRTGRLVVACPKQTQAQWVYYLSA